MNAHAHACAWRTCSAFVHMCLLMVNALAAGAHCTPQDQICASIGMFGSPSPLAISCTLFGLVLVNSLTYTFLLQVIYRVMLQVSHRIDRRT